MAFLRRPAPATERNRRWASIDRAPRRGAARRGAARRSYGAPAGGGSGIFATAPLAPEGIPADPNTGRLLDALGERGFPACATLAPQARISTPAGPFRAWRVAGAWWVAPVGGRAFYGGPPGESAELVAALARR